VTASISEDFARQANPFRRELLAHCYRMLGSVQDAEDLVQETLLRAWRASGRFDSERASLRTWLHAIATNACLTALAGRRRRPLPSAIAGPSDDIDQPLVRTEVPWLEPLPDTMVWSERSDPAAVAVSRSSLRLAFVAALQLLPPRQRAILVLREVLELPAAEVADMLGTTPAAVNSGLQRARAKLAGVAEEQIGEPAEPDLRATVDAYVTAFENADITALTRLLTKDAILEMPPVAVWYSGREDYGRFIARVFAMRGTDWRMVPVAANGQPAVAAYVGAGSGEYQLHSLQVLTVTRAGIARNVVWAEPGVFATFGLAPRLDAASQMDRAGRPAVARPARAGGGR
jgi:RNA polymerase sigma-70 factor, ECF subfamily